MVCSPPDPRGTEKAAPPPNKVARLSVSGSHKPYKKTSSARPCRERTRRRRSRLASQPLFPGLNFQLDVRPQFGRFPCSRAPPPRHSLTLPYAVQYGYQPGRDGQHWACIEGGHHTGVLFDAGEHGEWDSSFIAGAKLIYCGNKDQRMYYQSFNVNSGSYAIGIARSLDGLRWVKLGKALERGPIGSFDQAGVRTGHMVTDEEAGKYLMVYEGIGGSDGRVGIGLAESADRLKNWRRCDDGAVLTGCLDGEGWDCEGVAVPCLVQLGKEEGWRVYHAGTGKEGMVGIGVAVCQGMDLGSFVKWMGIRFGI